MPAKKHIQPGERVPLKLTATERKLLLDGVTFLDDELPQTIKIEDARKAKSKASEKSKAKADAGILHQFKITLLDIKPTIWRRIQVQDCTLDKLHEHIQTAMGWTNSHLHQFEIKGKRYGDLELLDDDFGDAECVDSTKTMVSKIVSKSAKRFAFKYEYDFGDGWDHEVVFEGCPLLDKDTKYPLCLEGERACPPAALCWRYFGVD